jgi:hypothetical protein
LFRGGLAWGVRCEARAFAIFRALRDTCLCLAIGIIVSVGVRGVSPGCRWCREIGSQVAGSSLMKRRAWFGSSGSQGLAVRDL